jgi:hypothetical protein
MTKARQDNFQITKKQKEPDLEFFSDAMDNSVFMSLYNDWQKAPEAMRHAEELGSTNLSRLQREREQL